MARDMLLIVRTALCRYAVHHDDLFEVKLIADSAELQASGLYNRPCLGVELGPLLDPSDQSTLTRRRALIVPLRRRYVALLVDYVDAFLEHAASVPLPTLLRERLQQPWVTGALALDDELIVKLDLRAVARSAMLSNPAES
ncbi:MAG: chemotaxis protein CheW [Roseiflexaceae bacterium]